MSVTLNSRIKIDTETPRARNSLPTKQPKVKSRPFPWNLRHGNLMGSPRTQYGPLRLFRSERASWTSGGSRKGARGFALCGALCSRWKFIAKIKGERRIRRANFASVRFGCKIKFALFPICFVFRVEEWMFRGSFNSLDRKKYIA